MLIKHKNSIIIIFTEYSFSFTLPSNDLNAVFALEDSVTLTIASKLFRYELI